MAQIKWQKRAEKELYRYLVKGFIEYGESTANKFASKVTELNAEMERFPELGFPEPLLKNRSKFYRARHINKRFKLIYYYSERTNTVHVVDIWDSKREPQSLAKRIK